MIQIYPMHHTRRLTVVRPEAPASFLEVICPEAIRFARADSEYSLGNTGELLESYLVPSSALNYRRREDGSVSREETVNGASYRAVWTPREDFVDVELSMTNTSAAAMPRLWWDICIANRSASDLYDPRHERTRVRRGGKIVRVCDTERGSSELGNLPLYLPADQSREPPELPGSERSYGLGWSKDRIDAPFVSVTALDGQWSVGILFSRADHLWCNVKPPFHGCTHVDPNLGDLAPAGRVGARGRLYYLRGGFEPLWARALEDLARGEVWVRSI